MEPSNQSLSSLLYDRQCPYDYQCLSNDCIECVKKHMEKVGAEGGKV